jgi:coenzyme F420-reducing hydrogenase alpha subunit
MHTTNLDISLEELSKIEGAASCNIKIRDGVVKECHFAISEMRRFFTQAVRGKQIAAVPQQVARICGTCSNAHLLASLKAIENGLGITVSRQTAILRQLLNFGLMIRDHGLHLYVFVLPDLFNRDSILEFDENNPREHELIHDCFAIKEAGNRLAIAAGGRSVHAPYVRIGSFSSVPNRNILTELIPILKNVRNQAVKLVEIFRECQWNLEAQVKFLALVDDKFTYLDGTVKTSDGLKFPDHDFAEKLNRVDIAYSQATGYKFDDQIHMVGALARLNLNRQSLHEQTKKNLSEALALFPSRNIFHNNLAQAIEIVHAIDSSIDLINQYEEVKTDPVMPVFRKATGIGLIEAPRGTLLHHYELNGDGTVSNAKIIVPTGQNQIGIEEAIRAYISSHLNEPKEILEKEIEKIVRAYDPCMSCASHFLKFRWSRGA